MSERAHLLVQDWLLQNLPKDNLQKRLKSLSAEAPYFSAAHLLLYKLTGTNDDGYAALKNMAALHVYNPLLLQPVRATETFDFPFNEDEIVVEHHTSTEEKEDVYADGETPDTLLTESTHQSTEQDFVEEKIIAPSPITENTDDAEPQIKMPNLNLQATANTASGITFEPYHTVDYFASQGIKLSQAEAGNDRFGKQVKSFTEWLKTMKKLPATAITSNTDGVGERKVENLAAHSVQNADIITESMAEVWIKQGNIQKASEVYNKLSLQNPSKKAYFAAKIESLKKPS